MAAVDGDRGDIIAVDVVSGNNNDDIEAFENINIIWSEQDRIVTPLPENARLLLKYLGLPDTI